jgi:hypothetical protein
MIKKFKSNISEVRKRSSANFRNMAVDSLVITIALIVVGTLLFSNVIRVISTGKSNYDTFLSEEAALAEIRNKNNQLSEEYDYVNSDEFKKLILRDTLGVADQSERLYKTKNEVQYFDEEVEYFDLRDISDYSQWWSQIFRI